jgi:hypothetical protein
MILGGLIQQLAENKEQAAIATTSIMTSSLLLNILLAASLQTLLTMVNTIQLVEMISMFNL